MTSQETGGTAMSTSDNFAPGNLGGEVSSPKSVEPAQAERTGSEDANALAWNEKGNTHFERGAYEDAINAYNKAIQLDPAFGWRTATALATYPRVGLQMILPTRRASLIDLGQERPSPGMARECIG
jgi:tetratricopeptide (TPR) repeat protein